MIIVVNLKQKIYKTRLLISIHKYTCGLSISSSPDKNSRILIIADRLLLNRPSSTFNKSSVLSRGKKKVYEWASFFMSWPRIHLFNNCYVDDKRWRFWIKRLEFSKLRRFSKLNRKSIKSKTFVCTYAIIFVQQSVVCLVIANRF